jgi:NAD-dependent dihydropyrimidine dehydrogenase PreA subunit
MPKRGINMKRKIVNIDESRCNGCAEGALQIINGKAKLVKDTYCDGLGACLGQCPQDAITVTEREADAFSEAEVHEYLKSTGKTKPIAQTSNMPQKPQWPVKLDLVAPKAPFLQNADLLLAADCAPVALKNFHDLMAGKTVIIGCPKFNDARAYAQKLTDILAQNTIGSITVLHMEVPCCAGLKWAVNKALEASGKYVPVRELEAKIGGDIVEL